MTIAELIEELRRYPPHLEVWHDVEYTNIVEHDGGEPTVDSVYTARTGRVVFEGTRVLLTE